MQSAEIKFKYKRRYETYTISECLKYNDILGLLRSDFYIPDSLDIFLYARGEDFINPDCENFFHIMRSYKDYFIEIKLSSEEWYIYNKANSNNNNNEEEELGPEEEIEELEKNNYEDLPELVEVEEQEQQQEEQEQQQEEQEQEQENDELEGFFYEDLPELEEEEIFFSNDEEMKGFLLNLDYILRKNYEKQDHNKTEYRILCKSIFSLLKNMNNEKIFSSIYNKEEQKEIDCAIDFADKIINNSRPCNIFTDCDFSNEKIIEVLNNPNRNNIFKNCLFK